MVLVLQEFPAGWKLGTVLIFQKGKKEDPGTHRPVSLISVPSKITEKMILGSIGRHLENNTVIGHSSMRGKSCLSSLISFHNRVSHLADQGKPGDGIF